MGEFLRPEIYELYHATDSVMWCLLDSDVSFEYLLCVCKIVHFGVAVEILSRGFGLVLSVLQIVQLLTYSHVRQVFIEHVCCTLILLLVSFLSPY